MTRISAILQKIRTHKWVILTLIIVACYGVYYYITQREGATVQNVMPTITKTKIGDIRVFVSGSGQVYATNQVDLKPQIAGDGLDIAHIAVKNDQTVKKGDLIANLNTTEIQKTIRDAKLAVENAELKVKQSARQYDTKTVDDKYARQLQKNELTQAQNILSNAYDDLEDYYIRAPFDGIVTALDFSVGDSISRDEVLASVITENVQVIISLNEVDAAKVKENNIAILSFDALDGVTTQGVVSKVDTIGVVDAGVVTYDVEISFTSPSELLKPGMSASADIEIEKTENVLIVPIEAIKKDASDKEYVQVQNAAGILQRKMVVTGATDDVMIEVVSGLDEGERVVIANNDGATFSTNVERKTPSGTSSILPMGPGAGGGSRN